MSLSGKSLLAGVVGRPIAHSLSPVLHNAWIAEAGLDAVYVPFNIASERFPGFIASLRGGSVRGLNVTLPFKGEALACADQASLWAQQADAANVLVFRENGEIHADNTDGEGLLGAFRRQAPGFDPAAGPAVILGAGGAARGAVQAFKAAGAPEILVLNRTLAKAQAIAKDLGPGVRALGLDAARSVFGQANAVINTTSAELDGAAALRLPLDTTASATVVMDMVYKPLVTPFLAAAHALGRRTVDGLEMLIAQAIPSFEAFYGQPPPAGLDVRALAVRHLES